MSEPGFVALLESGELENRVERLYALLASCTVCPRDCGNDRLANVLASCASGLDPVVSSYTAHFGEEPALSGTRGAGNIFFGNCNLRCVYCQNWQISQDWKGQRQNEVPVERLAEMLLELQGRGCHNIGFVSPTHYAPQMAKAVLLAARAGLRLPIVYNTNAYDSVEVLRLLDGIVDVYLPDFKYADSAAGSLYSKVPDYAERSRDALLEMYRQKGSALVFGEDGLLKSGLLVRMLVLPNGAAGHRGVTRVDRRDALSARRDLAHGAVLPDPPRGLERAVLRALPRHHGGGVGRGARRARGERLRERLPAGARDREPLLPPGLHEPGDSVQGRARLHKPLSDHRGRASILIFPLSPVSGVSAFPRIVPAG